ncbi:DoxX family membrane protein [Pendulispora brunnea]|uniref:DoxX family membrane protein n=1 Tax=Pendulispora brunnea TaxID=2905690 RepID=A0ABZ2KC25_9BACT
MQSRTLVQPAQLVVRFGLGTAFLSAVADRFGLWGPAGTPGVAWGDFLHFTMYTRDITWFMPALLTPLLAWMATIGETLFGVLLLLGYRTRETALGAGGLLLTFALSMTVSSPGLHGVFTYSVLSAAGAALLLATVPDPAWSFDALVRKSDPAA